MKARLFEILSTLSDKEYKDFQKYVKSPYFNRNENLIKLSDYLEKFLPDFENPRLTKEAIHKHVYKDLKFDDAKIRVLLSDMNSKAENFLTQMAFDGKNVDKDFYLIDQLSERKISKRLETVLDTLEEKLKNEELNLDVLLWLIKLESERFNFQITNKFLSTIKDIRSDIFCLLKREEYLVYFIVLDILKSTDILYKYLKYNKYSIDDALIFKFIENVNFEKILREIGKLNSEYSDILNLYYKSFLTFSDLDNHKYYLDFKKTILSEKLNIGHELKKFFFTKLIDYCITKNKFSKTREYDSDLFEVYKIFISEKMYKTPRNPYFYPDLFRNIVSLAIRLNKISWCEKFIKDYSSELHHDVRNSMFNFSMCRLMFQQKKYNEAYTYLNKVKFDMFVFKYDIRNLSLMLNYDLKNYDQVLNQIDSYRHFLNYNENITEQRFEAILNFMKCIGNLVKSTSKFGIERSYSVDKIEEEVLNTKMLLHKEWLLEKTAELKE